MAGGPADATWTATPRDEGIDLDELRKFVREVHGFSVDRIAHELVRTLETNFAVAANVKGSKLSGLVGKRRPSRVAEGGDPTWEAVRPEIVRRCWEEIAQESSGAEASADARGTTPTGPNSAGTEAGSPVPAAAATPSGDWTASPTATSLPSTAEAAPTPSDWCANPQPELVAALDERGPDGLRRRTPEARSQGAASRGARSGMRGVGSGWRASGKAGRWRGGEETSSVCFTSC